MQVMVYFEKRIYVYMGFNLAYNGAGERFLKHPVYQTYKILYYNKTEMYMYNNLTRDSLFIPYWEYRYNKTDNPIKKYNL